MREMHSDHTPIPPLQAIFEGAKRFGLTEDEAWRAVDESVYEVGPHATISEYLDLLTGALAQRILSKQRHIRSKERCSAPEERRVPSEEHF